MHQRWTHQGQTDRLDRILAEHLALTRGEVRRAIEARLVLINHKTAQRNAQPIQPGTLIQLTAPIAATNQQILPEPHAPLAILHQADDWIAANKPAGQPVHPLRPDETGTLLNAAVARYPHTQGVGEAGLRSGVVHRLDVTTSGVILIATTQKGWEHLRQTFASRDITKRYLALVEGRLEGQARCIMDLRITEHSPARVNATPPADQGDPPPQTRRCDLAYRSIASGNRASLLEIDLGTGFLHQIRAMMAANGHPIVGDAHYGSTTPAPRPILHARRIEFDDHIIEAPIPDDVMQAIETHGLTFSP